MSGLGKKMIPKTIHYCWFGRNPKPKLFLKCENSWRKYCGEYKLVEWNEDIFDIKASPLYVQQAYKAGKWAFITDYVRLYALFHQGGIYMDTDVEVTKSLDVFLKHKGFSGFEDEMSVPTGIMAAEAGHPLIREWLEEYDSRTFFLPDGMMNLETNVVTITNSMKGHGLRLDNSLQTVADFTFYPKDYFCPKSYHDGKIYKTRNTHSIHHFAGSWKSEDERKAHEKWIRHERVERITRPGKDAIKSLIGEKTYGKIKERVKGHQ